jgi:hypothetical protein
MHDVDILAPPLCISVGSAHAIVACTVDRPMCNLLALNDAAFIIVEIHGFRWNVGTFLAPVSLSVAETDLHVIFRSFFETGPIAAALESTSELFSYVGKIHEERYGYESIH